MNVATRDRTLLTTAALAGAFFLLALSGGLGWMSKDPYPDPWYIVRWEAINSATGFAVSLALFMIYDRLERVKAAAFWPVAVALCYAGGMSWRFLTGLFMWHVGMNDKFKADFGLVFIRGGLVDGTTLALLSSLYFSIEHWRQAAEQREKARQATSLAHQAQLAMLRYQLNPHFLFNVLNSIRGMIVENPDRSRRMVTELADFLRYSLDGKGPDSTIGDETAAVESYLSIQRIRFEERLDATVQVEDDARGVRVPCFLIQPLVENAVKFGMRTSAMPLRLRVSVRRRGDEVSILVENSGRLVEAPVTDTSGEPLGGARIGLANIVSRLELVFPRRYSFGIRERDGWVRAEIHLTLTPGGEDEAADRADCR